MTIYHYQYHQISPIRLCHAKQRWWGRCQLPGNPSPSTRGCCLCPLPSSPSPMVGPAPGKSHIGTSKYQHMFLIMLQWSMIHNDLVLCLHLTRTSPLGWSAQSASNCAYCSVVPGGNPLVPLRIWHFSLDHGDVTSDSSLFFDLQSHEIWNKRFSSISFSSMFPSSGAPPPGMDGSYTKHWQPEGFFRRIITWMEFKHKAVSSKKVHASICLLLMPTLASSRNGVKFWANQMSFESCWNIQRRTITGSMIVSLFSSFRHCRNTETLPLFGKVTPCSP